MRVLVRSRHHRVVGFSIADVLALETAGGGNVEEQVKRAGRAESGAPGEWDEHVKIHGSSVFYEARRPRG